MRYHGAEPALSAAEIEGIMVTDARIREMVRTQLTSHALFPFDGKSWAGPGSGRPCTVCAEVIAREDVEYEIIGSAGVAFAHLPCYLVWRQESALWRGAWPGT